MATRAESLIRQFCEQRTREVNEEASVARRKVPERIPVTQLPVRVRRAIAAYRHHDRLRDAAQKILKQAGVETYRLTQGNGRRVNNVRKDEQLAAINKRQAERAAAIRELRDRSYVAIMGAKPEVARVVVERIQKELAEI